MDRRSFVITAVAGGFVVALQNRSAATDLAALAANNGFTLVNRSAKPFADGARKGARLSEAPGEGVAFVPGLDFSNGTIECDLRGKDVSQQSFLGIAFHGANSTTYDAVYFRPFNFRASDPVSRRHAVQYHSNPDYGWQRLRTEHPDQYEKAVNPVPDPNGWFHMRLVVESPRISVFVDDAKEPSLTVNQLSQRTKGLLGLWVGNNSGGDFANLTIVPK
jgi:hypothetical protein